MPADLACLGRCNLQCEIFMCNAFSLVVPVQAGDLLVYGSLPVLHTSRLRDLVLFHSPLARECTGTVVGYERELPRVKDHVTTLRAPGWCEM